MSIHNTKYTSTKQSISVTQILILIPFYLGLSVTHKLSMVWVLVDILTRSCVDRLAKAGWRCHESHIYQSDTVDFPPGFPHSHCLVSESWTWTEISAEMFFLQTGWAQPRPCDCECFLLFSLLVFTSLPVLFWMLDPPVDSFWFLRLLPFLLPSKLRSPVLSLWSLLLCFLPSPWVLFPVGGCVCVCVGGLWRIRKGWIKPSTGKDLKIRTAPLLLPG